MLTARLQRTDAKLRPEQCMNVEDALGYLHADEEETVRQLIISAMDRVETLARQPLFVRDYFGLGSSFTDTTLASMNVTAVSAVHYQVQGDDQWRELARAEWSWWESGEVFFSDYAKRLPGVARVRVSYKAGYTPSLLPDDILQAVRYLIARWYDNRGDEKAVDTTAEKMLSHYLLPVL